MAHLTEDYNDAPEASEHNETASAATEAYTPDATPQAQKSRPANENVAPVMRASAQAFEASAEESFRIGGAEKREDLQAFYAAGGEACETMAHTLRASLEEVASGIGQFNARLMEFGRINAQNGMAFVQTAAGIRSLQDAVDIQTSYIRDQYGTAAEQLRELQALTTEIAQKATAPFQQQFMRSTQMFRSC